MERFFGELIAIRLLLGRVLANQAYASGDAATFLKDQMAQAERDIAAVSISAQSKDQEAAIRTMATAALEDIVSRIKFAA